MSESRTVTGENGVEYFVDEHAAGAPSLTFKSRSAAAKFLRSAGYSVEVVVTGPGGAPLSEDSIAFITAAMTAPKGVAPADAAHTVQAARALARNRAAREARSERTPSNKATAAPRKSTKARAA